MLPWAKFEFYSPFFPLGLGCPLTVRMSLWGFIWTTGKIPLQGKVLHIYFSAVFIVSVWCVTPGRRKEGKKEKRKEWGRKGGREEKRKEGRARKKEYGGRKREERESETGKKRKEKIEYTLGPSPDRAFIDVCVLEKKHIDKPCNISVLEGEIPN